MTLVLEVRRAVPTDIGPLAEVHARCWQETYRGLLSEEFMASRENLPEIRMVLPGHGSSRAASGIDDGGANPGDRRDGEAAGWLHACR